MRLRRVVARLIAILGVIAVTAGAALGQLRRGLFDSGAFADRLAFALGDPRVAAYVAEEITGVVLREKPDLVAVRPLLRATAQSVVSTDAFQSIVRVTAREAHAAMFSRGGRNLLLSVPDVGLILRGAVANASPTLAARIPPRLSTVIADLGRGRAGRFIIDLWQLGRALAWAAWIGVLGGLALLVAGIALAPRRSEALRWSSVDLALAGLLLLIVFPVGRLLATSIPESTPAQEAVAGLYDVFIRGLRRLALGLCGAGLVLSAAAYSLLGPRRISQAARRARDWLTQSTPSTGHQVLRGALLLVV